MHTTRRAAACLGAAVAATVALTACGSSSDASSSSSSRPELSLNIGYIDTSINGVGITATANQLDLWKQAGLKVKLVPFTNGPTQVQAMQAGQIDVGYIGGGAAWMPASGKATVIAPSEISTGDVVLASKKSGITSAADLKGRKVAAPDGGSGELILALALLKQGLSLKDVQRVTLDPPSIVSAFVSGQVEAAGIFSPLSNQIMQSKPDTVTVAKNADFPDTSFLGAWVASNDAVKSKADALQRFLEVYIRANDYRIKNTDKVVEYASKASGAPVAQLKGQASVSGWSPSAQILADNASGKTFAQFESLEKVFVQTGRLTSVADPKTFVNVDLFAKAAQQVNAK